jgi:hypothetical protein
MTQHSPILNAQPTTQQELFTICVAELLVRRLGVSPSDAMVATNTSASQQPLMDLCQEAAHLAQEPFRDSKWAQRWEAARERLLLCARSIAEQLKLSPEMSSTPPAHKQMQKAKQITERALYDALAAAEWCLEVDFVKLSLHEREDRLLESPFQSEDSSSDLGSDI